MWCTLGIGRVNMGWDYLRYLAERCERLLELLCFDFWTQVADEYVVVFCR